MTPTIVKQSSSCNMPTTVTGGGNVAVWFEWQTLLESGQGGGLILRISLYPAKRPDSL